MLFSSNVFIFIFLPGVLFVYYALLRKHRKLQNTFLCLASLFFYAWGEPKFVLVMMLSICVNWFFGLMTGLSRERGRKNTAKAFVAFDVLFNLTVIFIFKYLMFAVTNLNRFAGTSLKVPEIALPIGISFFTFQAMSYVIDVYRGRGAYQKNILNVGLYISLFPQLIAGPIVRYETVADEIMNRKENLDDFTAGCKRFIIGLAKKVIIANNVAMVADHAFAMLKGANFYGESGLSFSMAWLGIIAYTLQIFFDFSGYSDMAIGLGRMFGFHFLENFNYPYISLSVTEFWRRWHISLGTWFRDYLYIPLGGNRTKTKARHLLNIFMVWFCTGVWHGANWTFIAWGLLYFFLLVFEKYSGFDVRDEHGRHHVIKHIYLLLVVMCGWVIFRADNLGEALAYLRCMFVPSGQLVDGSAMYYGREFWMFMALGALFSMPVIPKISSRLKGSRNVILAAAEIFIVLALFLVSVSYLVKSSYNPFIYFNF